MPINQWGRLPGRSASKSSEPAASGEYFYSSDVNSCSDAYLWPALQRILEQRAPAPRRLFELGCGNGATARMLSARGYDVLGVDPSSSGIAIARDSVAEGRVRFEEGTADEELGARFGRFPVVVSLEVIEHCASARQFMRGLTSVLAPDGVAVISTPYHAYLKNLLVIASGSFDRHFDPLWEGGHLRFFSVAKLRALCEEFGFQGIEFQRVGRVPPLAKSMLVVATNRARP